MQVSDQYPYSFNYQDPDDQGFFKLLPRKKNGDRLSYHFTFGEQFTALSMVQDLPFKTLDGDKPIVPTGVHSPNFVFGFGLVHRKNGGPLASHINIFAHSGARDGFPIVNPISGFSMGFSYDVLRIGNTRRSYVSLGYDYIRQSFVYDDERARLSDNIWVKNHALSVAARIPLWEGVVLQPVFQKLWGHATYRFLARLSFGLDQK